MLATACPKPTRALPAEKRRVRQVSAQESRQIELRAEWKCSELTRQRARGRCEITGQRGTEAHHGFGKQSHPSVRFDGRNLFWLTRKIHDLAHRKPEWFHEQMISILGTLQYQALHVEAVSGRQPDPADVLAAAKQGRFLVERT